MNSTALICKDFCRAPRVLSLLIASLFAALWPVVAQVTTDKVADAAKPPADVLAPESAKDNSITLGVGGWFTRGNDAQFMQRTGQRSGAFGGIENFHWEQTVTNQGLLKVDGRGLFDNHDYLLKMELSYPDRGYIHAGYREFRTWYDGSGGFFPRNGQFFNLYDDRLALDRGNAWFEAGWTPLDGPQVTFRYDYQFRRGQKDSTSWGDTSLTGLPPPNNVRNIVPSFWDIDEKRHIFAGDVKHTVGPTDLSLGLRYELVEDNNSLNEHRRPGEASDRFVTQHENFSSDLFNTHFGSETRCTDKLMFTMGYSFTVLDTDISGSRIYGADYDAMFDPTFARRQQFDEGFINLGGGAQLKQHVANFSVLNTPWEDFSIVTAVRVEKYDTDGVASFIDTAVGAAPGLVTSQTPTLNTSSSGFVDVSESLEARYTGLRDWAFYARGEWLEGNGSLSEREMNATTLALSLFRDTDSERFTQKYSLGANWYPLRNLNLGGQYYHKQRDNSYTHTSDSTSNSGASGDRYPAYLLDQNFTTDDMNVRVTWRPWLNLTLVTRYDFQFSTINTRPDGLAEVQSADVTTHIISESISWSPANRWYLQATLNYVVDNTDTPAQDISGGASSIILPARNNYWNASFTAGFALNEKADLVANYFYYRANNYTDNSSTGMPYGAGAEEHGFTASLVRRITANITWTLKYGYFRNRDTSSGMNNNYEAHLLYTSWRMGF